MSSNHKGAIKNSYIITAMEYTVRTKRVRHRQISRVIVCLLLGYTREMMTRDKCKYQDMVFDEGTMKNIAVSYLFL